MGLLDRLTRKPQPKKKAAARRSTATKTRSASASGYELPPKFPQQRASIGPRRAATPVKSIPRQGNALSGNTDSQIDRRLARSGRPVDSVLAAYHSPGDAGGKTPSGKSRSNPRGGGGGSSTKGEKDAVARLKTLARYNSTTATDQLDRQLGIYDQADRQNQALADVEKKQHSMEAADDRFLRMKNLQAAASGINAKAGNALQGSTKDSLGRMLRTRDDMDTVESLNALRSNWNAVENALAESMNANVLARRGAISDTERALRTIRADTAAQLGNIGQKYFVSPDKLKGIADPLPKRGKYDPKEYRARLSGYIR